jgi:UDP-glucose 4-epimerase
VSGAVSGSSSGLVVGLTGPTGHIGSVLLLRLLADPGVGQVRTVARRPLPAELMGRLPADRLVHTLADLRQPSARRALEGVDLLFHLAAQVWQGRSSRGLEEMYTANVEGTRNVVLARPGALVFASSAAVYGAWPDNPLPMNEDHEPRPNIECSYAVQKLVAERTSVAEVPRHVIVRLAAVLGAHADARVAQAVRGYRLAVPAVTGTAQAVQWLDEGDAAEGLLAAGRALLNGDGVNGSGVAGEVVNLGPAGWLEAHDVALLARSRVVKLPRRTIVSGAEVGRRLGLSPFGADRAVLITGPLALSVSKADRLLGWKATSTSSEVLAAALENDWYRLPRNRQI